LVGGDVVSRELRQRTNRELYREVNDRIAAVAQSLGAATDTFTFICECSRTGCRAQIDAPIEVYARVRERPGAYLVAAGHEDAGSEDAIFGHDRTRSGPDAGSRSREDDPIMELGGCRADIADDDVR
jgi:hypothetical protein